MAADSGRDVSCLRGSVAVALAFFFMFAPVANADGCVDLHPVMFVHGSGLDSSTWVPMRRAFEHAGYPSEWLSAPDLKPNDGSNSDAAARQIAPAVDSLLEVAKRSAVRAGCPGPSKIDIVAHSMGVVSARWYISQIDATRVRNLVGIAPANHGSNALCGLRGEGNREMCPAFAKDATTNPIQVRLNGTAVHPIDETPYGSGEDPHGISSVRPDESRRVNYLMIRLDPDEWIVPADSAILSGAGGLPSLILDGRAKFTSGGNLLWLAAVGHDELPRDERLIAMMVASLQTNTPQ
jgi:pimeloyl-ACP methyl ester carboxylesterase